MPEFKKTPRSNKYARNMVSSVFSKAGIKVDIEMVEATELVKKGGCFNCASWTFKGQKR